MIIPNASQNPSFFINLVAQIEVFVELIAEQFCPLEEIL